MTAPDLLRQLADCMEAKEALEAEVAALRAENAMLRVKTAGEPAYLTVAEAAKYISMSKSFFDHDRTKPQPLIPFCRAGEKKVLYSRADLESFATGKRSRKKEKEGCS